MALDPQAVAWGDQFRAEFRDTARELFKGSLEAAGNQLPNEVLLQLFYDPLFECGGVAFAIVAARHGALKKADF